MQSIDDWTDLKVFAAVVREGSLVAAARSLGVNHSTVFRRIRRLEDRLGSRLLVRSGRTYRPSKVGEDVYEIASGIGADITALERRVQGADAELRGEVCFSTVAEVMPLLRTHLAAFRARFPGIRLRLRIAERQVDLTAREADVAIRAGSMPDDAELAGRRIGSIPFAAYAARSYLEGHPRPAGADELEGALLVTFDETRSHWGTMKWISRHAPDAEVALRADTIAGQLEGALAGLGIALLPRLAADPREELERLFDVDVQSELWMLWHRDLRRTARVRAFSTFIGQALEQALDV